MWILMEYTIWNLDLPKQSTHFHNQYDGKILIVSLFLVMFLAITYAYTQNFVPFKFTMVVGVWLAKWWWFVWRFLGIMQIKFWLKALPLATIRWLQYNSFITHASLYKRQLLTKYGEGPGLVAMGGDSCSKDLYTGWTFSH